MFNLSNLYLDWRYLILGANNQQSQGKDRHFGMSHGEIILRPGNHLLAELCVQAQVFSSWDAESGVLEIPVTIHFQLPDFLQREGVKNEENNKVAMIIISRIKKITVKFLEKLTGLSLIN